MAASLDDDNPHGDQDHGCRRHNAASNDQGHGLRQSFRLRIPVAGQVRQRGEAYDLGENYMVIGTSALVQTYIDGAVNIYAGIYNNPFLIWGKYKKGLFKAALPLSFQFHHVQMDGSQAACFLEALQREIRALRP